MTRENLNTKVFEKISQGGSLITLGRFCDIDDDYQDFLREFAHEWIETLSERQKKEILAVEDIEIGDTAFAWDFDENFHEFLDEFQTNWEF